jgi:hypothetical protein
MSRYTTAAPSAQFRNPVSPVFHHKWDALVMARKAPAPNGVVAVAQLSDDPTLTPVES